MLLADAAMPDPDLVGKLAQGSPFGVVTGLLIWIVYSGLPKIQQQFEKNTEMFMKLLTEQGQRHDSDRAEFMRHESERSAELAKALHALATATQNNSDAIAKLAVAIASDRRSGTKRRPVDGGSDGTLS